MKGKPPDFDSVDAGSTPAALAIDDSVRPEVVKEIDWGGIDWQAIDRLINPVWYGDSKKYYAIEAEFENESESKGVLLLPPTRD